MPEPHNVFPTGCGLLLGDKGYVTFPLLMEGVAFRMTNTLWSIPGYHGVPYAIQATKHRNTIFTTAVRSNVERFFF